MIRSAAGLPQKAMRRFHRVLCRTLPNHWRVNYALALPQFWNGNKRLPRRIDDPTASLNDVIFQRMVRDDWSELQRACVDKERVKDIVRAKVPHVKIARTEAVLPLDDATTADDVAAFLKPFLKERLVVKPTHSCGVILYLDRPLEQQDLAGFVQFSKRNFFHAARETQYRRLPRKLIVEENIAPLAGLNDYKFTCADGHVLHGRLDTGRFTNEHRRALFTVPDFEIIPVSYGGLIIPAAIDRPPHFSEMAEIASRLSRGFDFVRVDLYDTPAGVYFGELTFTPCAGSTSYSDEALPIDLARRWKAIMANMQPRPVIGAN